MKVKINGYEVEGTPDEVALLLKTMDNKQQAVPYYPYYPSITYPNPNEPRIIYGDTATSATYIDDEKTQKIYTWR